MLVECLVTMYSFDKDLWHVRRPSESQETPPPEDARRNYIFKLYFFYLINGTTRFDARLFAVEE